MRNLMTFKLFESSDQHMYEFDDIKKLPGYLLLLAIGYYDSSTNVMRNHMNMRLYNDELGIDDPSNNVVVYGNGYVRKISPSWTGPMPHVMKKFDDDYGLARWNDQFMYIYDWSLKQYKKKGIASRYKEINKSDFISGESVMKYMVGSYATDPASIFPMYDSLDEPNKKKFLKSIKTTEKDFENNKRKYELSMNIVKNWLR
jgi:hypothetical protein